MRITTFVGREDALLIHVGNSTEPVSLPLLTPPFTKTSVAETLKLSNVAAQVIESLPGRWTRALSDARNAERGAIGNRQRQMEAMRACMMRGSVDPRERERSTLIARLQAIPGEQRETRAAIAEAVKRRATTGSYIPRDEFQRLRDREAYLKEETIALQGQLSHLNDAIKVAEQTHRVRFLEAFLKLAKDSLDEDSYSDLVEAAHEEAAQ